VKERVVLAFGDPLEMYTIIEAQKWDLHSRKDSNGLKRMECGCYAIRIQQEQLERHSWKKT
jgi:hypothetical protein